MSLNPIITPTRTFLTMERMHYEQNQIGFKFLERALAAKSNAMNAILAACESAGVSAKGCMYSTARFNALSRGGREVIVSLSGALLDQHGRWEYRRHAPGIVICGGSDGSAGRG